MTLVIVLVFVSKRRNGRNPQPTAKYMYGATICTDILMHFLNQIFKNGKKSLD